jgi:hypothetical protein
VNDPRSAEEPITVSPWYAKGYESTSSEEEPDLAKQVPKQVPKRTISGRMFSSAKKMLSRKPSLTADRKAELKAQRPPPSIKKK